MTTYNPLADNKRIAIIDILRGWALLGVVLMNYHDIYGLLGKAPVPNGLDKVLLPVTSILFEAKSWTLLSFLFGYGFAVLIDNVSKKNINPVAFFTRRMFWLFVLAAFNTAVWFGDILKDYAVMGLVLLLFRRCSAKRAFYISLSLLLVNPLVAGFSARDQSWVPFALKYFKLYQNHNLTDVLKCGFLGTYYFEVRNQFYLLACHETILLCFLLGLAAQKINFFGRLSENMKYIKRTFWWTLVLSIILTVSIKLISSGDPKTAAVAVLKVYNISLISCIASMLCIFSAICWLFQAGKLRRLFSLLQVYGKMTLTNYLMQDVLGFLIFSGAGLGLAAFGLSYGMYMLVGSAIYILQIYLSYWWLSRYHYGPIEWIWRQLTYQKRLPLKIRLPQETISQGPYNQLS